jgi:LDH2 family malate/lactate/ureidoglycolate dehydrogenase
MGRAGQALPPGWAIDAAGEPTLDAAQALAGALLPFGGHKGSALSMMVELIAGPLIGEPTSRAAAALDNGDGGPPLGGELLIAMSPEVFTSGLAHDWQEQTEAFFAQASEQPGVRLPSDRRHEARRRSEKYGVEVPDTLLQELARLSPAARSKPAR